MASMADIDQVLEKFGKLLEPLRTQLYEQGANIIRLVQGQERLEKRMDKSDTAQSHIVTALEAVGSGLKDVQANTATKQDIERLEAKQEETKEELKAEMQAGLPNPDKN